MLSCCYPKARSCTATAPTRRTCSNEAGEITLQPQRRGIGSVLCRWAASFWPGPSGNASRLPSVPSPGSSPGISMPHQEGLRPQDQPPRRAEPEDAARAHAARSGRVGRPAAGGASRAGRAGLPATRAGGPRRRPRSGRGSGAGSSRAGRARWIAGASTCCARPV